MTKHYCDRCGEELTGNTSKIFKIRTGYGIPGEDKKMFTDWDYETLILCEDCEKDFWNMMGIVRERL